MKSLFSDLGLIIAQQISDRDNFRKKVAGWEQQRGTYTPEAIAQNQKAEFPSYMERTRANVEKLENTIQKMKAYVLEQEAAWASGDSAKLTNALKIIELSNPIDSLTIKTIREAFRGDITTLRTLKSILETKQNASLTDTNNILTMDEISAFDDMIYDANTAFDNLLESGKEAFYTGKSLSRFIKDANHIAQFHGVAEMAWKADATGNYHEAEVSFGTAKEDPIHLDLYGDDFAVEEQQQPTEDDKALNKAFGLK